MKKKPNILLEFTKGIKTKEWLISFLIAFIIVLIPTIIFQLYNKFNLTSSATLLVLAIGVLIANFLKENRTKKMLGFTAFQKTAIILICIILVVDIISIVIYFAYPPEIKNKIETGFKEYKNSDIAIKSMMYPEDWSFTISEDKAITEFFSPDGSIGLSLGLYIYDEAVNLNTFTSKVLESIPKDSGTELTIIKEEIKKIDNYDWLISDRILKIDNEIFYQRFGLMVTGNYDNRQIIQIILETNEENFDGSKLLFDKIINSIQFIEN